MTTQYAVKYELSHTHTGRTHETMAGAINDLRECQSSRITGNDQQGIYIVAIEDGLTRHMSESEMDEFSRISEQMGVEC